MNIQIVKPTTTTSSVGKPGAVPPNVSVKPLLIAPAKTAAALPDADSSASQSTQDLSAPELLNLAREKLRSGDLMGAKETLDIVKAKDPSQENLWIAYGYIAGIERNFEESGADFRKELSLHPDSTVAAGALAEIQSRNGDFAGARQTIQQFLDHHPGNLQLAMLLASLQTKAEDYAGALRTLQAVADQNPDNRGIQLQIANTLLRLNRNQEAAAAAMSVLDGTDDPGLLNDAAYALGETGLNLPLAEEASRKSIARLEENSATIDTTQANSRTFAQANLLVASWDTLGWILFKESKLEAAMPLLYASWRASLQAEVGDHLGQLYEAMGKKEEAASTYVLAQTAVDKNVTPDVTNHIKESIARLEAAGAKPGPGGAEALQNLRTFKVARSPGVGGWGAFRLVITSGGVVESQQMSGEQKVAGIKDDLGKMKLPALVPPDSKAHLLRSAVISCSMGTTCEVVLVPDGGLQTEQQ